MSKFSPSPLREIFNSELIPLSFTKSLILKPIRAISKLYFVVVVSVKLKSVLSLPCVSREVNTTFVLIIPFEPSEAIIKSLKNIPSIVDASAISLIDDSSDSGENPLPFKLPFKFRLEFIPAIGIRLRLVVLIW